MSKPAGDIEERPLQTVCDFIEKGFHGPHSKYSFLVNRPILVKWYVVEGTDDEEQSAFSLVTAAFLALIIPAELHQSR